MGGIQRSKGSETDSFPPKVLTTTNFVVLVICVIYERFTTRSRADRKNTPFDCGNDKKAMVANSVHKDL